MELIMILLIAVLVFSSDKLLVVLTEKLSRKYRSSVPLKHVRKVYVCKFKDELAQSLLGWEDAQVGITGIEYSNFVIEVIKAPWWVSKHLGGWAYCGTNRIVLTTDINVSVVAHEVRHLCQWFAGNTPEFFDIDSVGYWNCPAEVDAREVQEIMVETYTSLDEFLIIRDVSNDVL